MKTKSYGFTAAAAAAVDRVVVVVVVVARWWSSSLSVATANNSSDRSTSSSGVKKKSGACTPNDCMECTVTHASPPASWDRAAVATRIRRSRSRHCSSLGSPARRVE